LDKILITGGSGLFGSNFALRQNKHFKIFLVQNKKKIFFIKKPSNVFILKEKINNKNNIKKLFDQIKPDHLIHAAAITDLEFCEKYKRLATITNYNLTKDISNECNKRNCNLIFLSSDQLFNGTHNYYSEKSNTSPLNFYSKLKIRSENYIKKNLKKYLIIRTNFFGWGTDYRSSFSDNIIFKLKKRKKISILKDVSFNPLSLKYLCESINKLIIKKKIGTYNISSSKELSKYKLAEKIADKFKLNKNFLKPVSLNNLKSKVIRPRNMSLSNIKLSKIYKVPSINIQINNLFKEYNNKYYINFKKNKNNEKN